MRASGFRRLYGFRLIHSPETPMTAEYVTTRVTIWLTLVDNRSLRNPTRKAVEPKCRSAVNRLSIRK